MKKKYKTLAITLLYILSTACTDVIEVEVPTAEPRLVIDAAIDCSVGEGGSFQVIKLSTTQPYFSKESTAPVKGATVVLTNNDSSEQFTFEDKQNGSYTISNFNPQPNNTYTLQITYNGEIYSATERLYPLVKIENLIQTTSGGWAPNVLKAKFTFDDPKGEENYYFVKYQRRGDKLPSLITVSDEFIDGNKMTVYCDHDDNEREYEAKDTVDIMLCSVSKNHYTYLTLLAQQIRDRKGNIFSTPPASLKSNCINQTNPGNTSLGYFRITMKDKQTVIFK